MDNKKDEKKAMRVGGQEFKNAILKPTFVDVGAVWCNPCKRFFPIFDKLKSKNPSIKFMKIDVDEDNEVMALLKSMKISIKSVPAVLVFRKGVFAEKIDADPDDMAKAAQKHFGIKLEV
jgi:thiol-disulfide isomerase/thioredoxin